MRSGFALTVGLVVVLTSGCFFHGGYPNGGYYGTGPGVVPQQPSTGFPGGPMYQPGGPVYPPGGSYPTPINGNVPYVPRNSPGNGGTQPVFTPTDPGSQPNDNTPGTYDNAPPFNPTPAGGRTVPVPIDDPDLGRSPGAQRPLTPITTATEPEDISPFSPNESRRSPRSYSDSNETLVETEDQFHPPAVRQASGADDGDGDIQLANRTTTVSRIPAKPFGHHPKFEWIQGTVEYDELSKTWLILYDDNPRSSDPLGGELTLADDPALARLRTGDTVWIEGSLDRTEEDSRGKPVFRMTRFKSL